jgi:5'-methylthioadenosine phosphorylase
VDRTRGREDTFYDGPQTTHVSAADPYCRELRATLAECARELDIPVADGGTVVVIQGPRFSSRAESRWFTSAGWDVVNMTQYPEAWLAREQELCYANISLVTDYDVGLEGMPEVPPVSADAAFAVFKENLDRLRALLFAAVPRIGPQPEDECSTALSSAIVHG